MYYPLIKRRDSYKKTRGGTNYANYREYFTEIAEDCQYRCVYCDISLKEDGGEGMQLDHFRPQKHFPQLATSPENLVLSCAKCNVLKSEHWPKSSDLNIQFLDHFSIPRLNHFPVRNNGEISPSCLSSGYMVDLMSLNRKSRCLIRRTRRLKQQAELTLIAIEDELINFENSPHPNPPQRLKELAEALSSIRDLISAI